MKKHCLTLLFAVTLALNPAHSEEFMTCSDIKPGSKNYSENLDILAKKVGLKDGYDRYTELTFKAICDKNTVQIESDIEYGIIKRSQVEAIKEELGLDGRSEKAKSYSYAKNKFLNMGLCEACAGNVTYYYANKPASKCGKLAKQALEGNPRAISELSSFPFPEYCTYKP